MTTIRHCLMLIICLELLGSCFLIARRLSRNAPPEADWSYTDASPADEIRAAVTSCESAEEWRKLGELYMAAGYFSESEMCHRVACELNPNDALVHRQWGFALERLGLLSEANLQYQRSMELSPIKAGSCRYFIARNLLRSEKSDEARRLLEEGQSLPACQYELAKLYFRVGKLTEAFALWSELKTRDPQVLQVNLLGYRLALERGDISNAQQFADQARYSQRKLQNPFDEEAERLVKATRQLAPSQHWTDVTELINNNRLMEARSLVDQQLTETSSIAGLELSAELALREGQYQAATRLFEELQKQHGPLARITARIGDVYDAAGEATKACEYWRKATQLETAVDLKAIHHKLADSLSKQGHDQAASKHRGLGHFYVGRELLQFGYAAQAIDYFQGAVELAPTFSEAWFYLGEAKRLSGQGEEARAAYQTCLEHNPFYGRALTSISLLKSSTHIQH